MGLTGPVYGSGAVLVSAVSRTSPPICFGRLDCRSMQVLMGSTFRLAVRVLGLGTLMALTARTVLAHGSGAPQPNELSALTTWTLDPLPLTLGQDHEAARFGVHRAQSTEAAPCS